MSENKYDVVVIGGGPAGYVAAIKAAQVGARTACVEKDILGGTCLNRGCIPTKNYLKSAEFLYEMEEAAARGISLDSTNFKIDMPKAVKAKNRVVKKLTGGVGLLLKANKVDVFYGTGIAKSATEVSISGGKSGEISLQAGSIILAGGSKAVKLPIPGVESDKVLTSDEILDIQEVPEALAVIGGGVIGIEMAMVFAAFGSKVTIVELEPRILPFMEKEAADLVLKSLKKKGVDVKTGIKLDKFEETKNGIKLVLGNGETVDVAMALLSIGRQADLSCVDGLNIKTERGKIIVDQMMETSVAGVFAPGDVNGRKMLAHAAFKMGEAAAVNAAKHAGVPSVNDHAPVKADMRYVPSVVYSIPEVSSVGLSEKEAAEKGAISVGYFPLSANGRALAAGATEGFVKVIADSRYGEILGVHMVGHGASEIINEAASLMAMEITVHEVADIVHGHPSVSEAFMEAAADCLGTCIHLSPKKNKKL